MEYRVSLTYVKEFVVEADSEEEAIDKAHAGDWISEGGIEATGDDEAWPEEEN